MVGVSSGEFRICFYFHIQGYVVFFFAVLPPASVPVPRILPLISFPLPYRPCLMLFNVPPTTYIADEPVLRSTDNSRKCTTFTSTTTTDGNEKAFAFKTF